MLIGWFDNLYYFYILLKTAVKLSMFQSSVKLFLTITLYKPKIIVKLLYYFSLRRQNNSMIYKLVYDYLLLIYYMCQHYFT